MYIWRKQDKAGVTAIEPNAQSLWLQVESTGKLARSVKNTRWVVFTHVKLE